jgi:flagellum-specific peptidoglycan hydrolase FlgJ
MYDYQAHFLERFVPASLGLQERTGLPASVVLAQAILESDWGRSELARRHHNYFGIKAPRRASVWTHDRPSPSAVARYPTTEFRHGRPRREKAGFAHYESIEECLQDYAGILSRRRYAAARAVTGNPPAFARALQRCGYATDPRYAHKLLILARRYRLDQYDLEPARPARTQEVEAT